MDEADYITASRAAQADEAFSGARALRVIGVYLLLAVVMTYPLVLNLSSAFPDSGADRWKTFWNYWWIRHALLDLQTWPFQTPLIYAPTGTPLNFDQLALVNALMVLPVQLLSGVFAAYNLGILCWFTLSGYAGYLLNRYLLRRSLPPAACRTGRAHLAAFGGGLIFAFAPTQFERLYGGNPFLMNVLWLALFILFTLQAVHARGFDLKRVGLAGLCFALGALTDWYQPLWLVLWLALFVPLRAWEVRRGGARAAAAVAARVAASLAAAALLLSPVLYGMASSLLTWGGGNFAAPYDQYTASSVDLLAFVTPPEQHPLFGALVQPLTARFTDPCCAHTAYIGYGALLLCAAGAAAFWHATRFWLASALAFAIYILGPSLHIAGQAVFYPLPFEAYYRLVPVLPQFTRSVSRGDGMVMLFLGAAAAFGAYQLGARRWAWVLLPLIVFEYLWLPLPAPATITPEFYRRLAAEQGDFSIMHIPMEFDRHEEMFYQTVHGKRMTSGFTARVEPSTWLQRAPVLQHFRQRGFDIITQDLRTVAPTVLRDMGVRYIVVDYSQMRPPSDELYYWQDHGKELVGEAPPVYQDEQMEVYAAPEVTRAVPYLRLETGWGILDPENWGTLEAEGWRSMATRAGLTVAAPEAQMVRIRFKAKAAAGATLRLTMGGVAVGQFTLTRQAQTFSSEPLRIAPGDNRLELSHDGAPYGARMAGLDILYP